MSKLFKLKEWLTVADAAKHLAIVFGEDVSEADVLRFALDGEFVLSVNLVNGARATGGELVPIDDASFEEVAISPNRPPTRIYGGPILHTDGIDSHVLKLSSDVPSLHGVFDLPMMGGERHDVENRFQALTGGPRVEMHSLDGAFVSDGNGTIYQLQEDFDDNEYQAGSNAALAVLQRRIHMGKMGPDDAANLLKQHADQRKEFLARRANCPPSECFYPAGGLPRDSVIVVRTKALTDFIASVNDVESGVEKPLSTRERDTIYKMLIVMAMDGYGYDPAASKNPQTKEIADALAANGLSVTDDTVRKYLTASAQACLTSARLNRKPKSVSPKPKSGTP